MLAGYGGPVAAMSFDPGLMAALRRLAPALPLGLVGDAARRRRAGTGADVALALRSGRRSRPARSSWPIGWQDLTSAPPLMARHVLRWPVLTWTVRSAEDRARAARYADQMIFEGFRP